MLKEKHIQTQFLGEDASHITLCLKVMKIHVSLRSGKQVSRKFQQITKLLFYLFDGVPFFAFMLLLYSQSTNMQCCHTHRAGTTPQNFWSNNHLSHRCAVGQVAIQAPPHRRDSAWTRPRGSSGLGDVLEFAFATDLMDNGKRWKKWVCSAKRHHQCFGQPFNRCFNVSRLQLVLAQNPFLCPNWPNWLFVQFYTRYMYNTYIYIYIYFCYMCTVIMIVCIRTVYIYIYIFIYLPYFNWLIVLLVIYVTPSFEYIFTWVTLESK